MNKKRALLRATILPSISLPLILTPVILTSCSSGGASWEPKPYKKSFDASILGDAYGTFELEITGTTAKFLSFSEDYDFNYRTTINFNDGYIFDPETDNHFTIIELGGGTFKNWSLNLSHLNFNNTDLIIPSCVQKIDEGFGHPSSIKSNIYDWKSITFNEGLKTIEKGAALFCYDSNNIDKWRTLSINLPSTLEFVGENAFGNYHDIYINKRNGIISDKPTFFCWWVTDRDRAEYGNVHVSQSMLDIYQNNSNWKTQFWGKGVTLSELPPMLKTNIQSVLTKWPDQIHAEQSLFIQDLKEANWQIDKDDSLWSYLKIARIQYDMCIVTVIDNPDYYGNIVKNITCYNAYCNINSVKHYIYNFNCFCNSQKRASDNIIFEDGYKTPFGSFNYQIIFNQKSSITKILNNFLAITSYNQELTLPEKITIIRDGFLERANHFNRSISLPTSLEEIGNSFMVGCNDYNKPITFPTESKLTKIGNNFMNLCRSFDAELNLPNNDINTITIGRAFLSYVPKFNRNISLPNSIAKVGTGFMFNAYNMTQEVNINNLDPFNVFEPDNYSLACDDNTQPCYKNGIKITGAYKTDFLDNTFQNSSKNPFRNLI